MRAPFTLTVDDRDPILVLEVELTAPPVEYVRSLHAALPDPAWRHVDEHGHGHRWARTGRGLFDHADALPTLDRSRVHVPCDGSCGTPLPEISALPEPSPDEDLSAHLGWLVASPGSEGDVSDLGEDCEGYDITVWHCTICGDPVEPGTIPDHQAMTTGVPIQVGPATAMVVIDSDPCEGDGDVQGFDAVLHAPDGTEMRGKAHVIDGQVRYSQDGIETRVTIEMAILDDPVRG